MCVKLWCALELLLIPIATLTKYDLPELLIVIILVLMYLAEKAADAPPPTTPADEKQTDPEATTAKVEKITTDAEDPADQTESLVPQEIPSATG